MAIDAGHEPVGEDEIGLKIGKEGDGVLESVVLMKLSNPLRVRTRSSSSTLTSSSSMMRILQAWTARVSASANIAGMPVPSKGREVRG